MDNQTANFTLRFLVKNLAQMERAINQIDSKLGRLADSAEKSQGDTQRVIENNIKSIDRMGKVLDKTILKWFSLGKAIQIIGSLVRKAFQKADEFIGLKAISESAGVATTKIERLGKALKESYGGGFSDAASAFSGLADILYGARTGKGISDAVAIASSRYGISLNAGNMSEEQLMTNIAVAMKNANATYGMAAVREIADAFGIDQAMMLHLTEKGAAWDRNLPASSLAQMQADAEKAKQLQTKLDSMIDQLVAEIFPAVVKGMEVLVQIGEKLFGLKNDYNTIKDARKRQAETNLKIIERSGLPLNPNASTEEIGRAARWAVWNKKYGNLPKSDSFELAQSYLDYYNANLATMGAQTAIMGLTGATRDFGGQVSFIPTSGGGQLILSIQDPSGALNGKRLELTSAQYATSARVE